MGAILNQRESVSDAQNGPQGRPPDEDLRGVRVAVHLAQEMGARLGGGEVLLGPVPGEEGVVCNRATKATFQTMGSVS